MDSQKQMMNDTVAVIERVQRDVESGKIRWPRAVRERVALLLKSGVSVDEIANAISIPRATLFRWARHMGLTIRGSRKRKGKFLEVKQPPYDKKVSRSQSRDLKLSRDKKTVVRDASLTLTFPKSQIVVTGSVLDIASLLRIMEKQ
jgi:transposase-like protein